MIVFGETGTGKSSLINMISGRNDAKTSNSATGCTYDSTPHTANLSDGSSITLWDTAGLNEGEKGTVTPKESIVNLYRLMRRLEGGVCLLVYCVRGPRIQENTVRNYKLFYSAFCQEKVPVVLVVTGLEEEEPMDAWWDRNQRAFEKQKMRFSAHACVTATRGKKKDGKYMYENEYESSAVATRKLVSDNYLRQPWKAETMGWLVTTIKTMYSVPTGLFDVSPMAVGIAFSQALKELGGLAEQEAKQLTRNVVDELKRLLPKNSGRNSSFDLKKSRAGDNVQESCSSDTVRCWPRMWRH